MSLALGTIASITASKQKAKKLIRDHEFSYLVHAEKTFPKTSDNLNLPWRLYCDMHEFIDD